MTDLALMSFLLVSLLMVLLLLLLGDDCRRRAIYGRRNTVGDTSEGNSEGQ